MATASTVNGQIIGRAGRIGGWCSVGLLILLSIAPARAAQVPAVWTGSGDGTSYNDPLNWDIAAVPLNNVTDTFVVSVPGGQTVTFDVAGVGNQVDEFTLASGSTLTMSSPELALEVLGAASIAGDVVANDGTLSAAAPTSTLSSRPRFFSRNGGQITVAAPSLSSTYSDNQTIMEADGVGSLLDLSTLTSLVANDNTSFTDTLSIRASNSGLIDLSNVASATSNDVLQFQIQSGGNINLDGLQSTSRVRFEVDVPTYSLPSLQTADLSTFDVATGSTLNLPVLTTVTSSTVTIAAGGTFNAPNLTDFRSSTVTLTPDTGFTTGPLVNVDSSRFFIQGGKVFDAVTATTLNGTYSDSQTIMSADGVGTVLDLSSLTSLVANDNTSFTDTLSIRATNSAVIDLSSVASATSNDVLQFQVQSGGDIDLSSLLSSTNVRFAVDVTSYTLPALESASGTTFAASANSTIDLPALAAHNGGGYTLDTDATANATALTTLTSATVTLATGTTFNAPNLTDFSGSTITLTPDTGFVTGPLANVDGSRFFIHEGRVYDAVTATELNGTYSDNQTIMEADGVGSLLDLSTLTSLVANDNTSFTDTLSIRASNSGLIDLSNVASATSNDVLQFQIQSGGDINLDGLQSTSRVRFEVDVPTYSLPSLQTTNVTTFDVATGSTLNLPALTTVTSSTVTIAAGGTFNAPNLTDFRSSTVTLTPDTGFTTGPLVNVDSSRFFIQGGKVFDAVTATTLNGTYSDSQTIMSADGVGTVLDLSSLTSLVANDNTSFTDTLSIRATNSAVIDLSNVASATSNDVLQFLVQSGGSIDLGKLQSASHVRFQVESGGTIRVGSATPADTTTIVVTDLASALEVSGDLALGAGSSVNVVGGGEMHIGGDYSFEQTDEASVALDAAIVRFDGAGSQLLEVGGEDLGAGGATGGNFGMGQLVIGTTTQRTSVDLLDVVDNGNRGTGATAEALYLYGLGGPAGLRILNNSALVLNGIDVYAWDPVAGSQVHLNGLFQPGELRIAYDNGYLQLVPLDFLWDNNSGGDFNVGNNWSDNLVPLGSDAAVWNLGSVGGYTVSFGTNTATDSAIIKTDRVTFDLGGYTYTTAGHHATASLVVGQSPGDDAQLTVTAGTLAARNGRVAADIGSTGRLHVTDTGVVSVVEDLILGTGQASLLIDQGGIVEVGGVLRVDDDAVVEGTGLVRGHIENAAGVVSPGTSTGILTVEGSYAQLADGRLTIELGGTDNSNPLSPEFDQLVVDGMASLGGALEVTLVDLGGGPLVPGAGDQFALLTATEGVGGQFDALVLPELAPGLVWRRGGGALAYLLLVAAELEGDYNGDGVVDAADYTVWRNTLGYTVPAGHFADGDASGTIDEADYDVWKANFGATAGGAALAASNVPEPASALLLCLGVVGTWLAVARSAARRG